MATVLALAMRCPAAEEPVDPSLPRPPSTSDEVDSFKQLTLEQLMDIEVVTVTSVSRRPERIIVAASAVQVVTQDDIRRSGATNLPDALRLATNLAVAQIDPHSWAISARGFNNNLADKMLVMIDGRTVYTPLFAGVFWDMQDTLLEDVDRIEVISGPGGTLWGANAVNGVISITTRRAAQTHGLYVEAGGGSTLQAFEAVRYGAELAPDLHYRVYQKAFHRDDLVEPYDRTRNAQWDAGQGGFRIDYEGWGPDLLTVQGDVYKSVIEQVKAGAISAAGGNLLARFTHRFSEESDASLQAYWDRVHRAIPNSITDDLDTWDLDFQHRFPLAPRNDVVWGLGYRVYHDEIQNPATLAFVPADVTHQVFSAFAQDEITVVRDRVFLTIGSKVENNDFTGFEFQPSGRVAWRVDERNSLWGAVSRAVRTPSRIDRELYLPGTPPYTTLVGGNFTSEKLIAYELGYRVEPEKRLSCSLATFYNVYSDVRSVEQANPPAPFPLMFGNGLEGDSYGAEAVVDSRLIDRVRMRVGYTAMRVRLHPKPESTDTSNGRLESHDPKHMASLRTSVDLADDWELDANVRYVSGIDTDDVPAYGELDLRLGWSPMRDLELALVGQNLLHDHHAEYGAAATRQEISRSGYVKLVWRY
ncbi:MAG: TonB-dependent receptor [Planctomycetes bacterium]|nr:TonB-dependent receptor [Planctomycetota bacterium]